MTEDELKLLNAISEDFRVFKKILQDMVSVMKKENELQKETNEFLSNVVKLYINQVDKKR